VVLARKRKRTELAADDEASSPEKKQTIESRQTGNVIENFAGAKIKDK